MTWKPIETAPKDGTDILLLDKYENPPFVVVGFWGTSTEDNGVVQWRVRWDHTALTNVYDPTYWTEIPEMPK